jgi:hypothetical protein
MSVFTKPVIKCHNTEEENFDKPAVFMFMLMFIFVQFVYKLSMAGKVYNMVFWIMTACSLVRGDGISEKRTAFIFRMWLW